MKRIFGVLAVAAIGLVGCESKKTAVGLDGGTGDMRMASTDIATSSKLATGEPCTANTQCQGNLCLTEAQGFPDGYCSRACTSDTQCGDDVCYPLGASQNGCLTPCEANDCRDGYGCWTDGVCLPHLEDYLVPEVLCDPTTFTNPNCTAGQICRRLEHSDSGGANMGVCDDICIVGEDTCGEDAGYACQMVDNSKVATADFMGLYTNDKGIAPKCVAWNLDVVTQNDVADDCSFEYMGDTFTFSFACVETAQCAMSDAANVNGYGDPVVAGGDNKCRTLCYKDGAKPVINPDAGVEGTPFVACGGGTTCKDAFGTFNNTNGLPQVGLCQP